MKLRDVIQPKNGVVCFATTVGSRLWRNERPDSDLDIFVCYTTPVDDVLLGHTGKSYQTLGTVLDNGLEADVTFHEAGSVAQQLLKGNPNFLIGLYSNMPVEDTNRTTGNRFKLITAMEGNISKACYPAFKGYGIGHYIKYIESGKDASERRCNIAVRFFRFGENILRHGKPLYVSVDESKPDDVYAAFADLEKAYVESTLPEQPLFPGKIEDWLLKMRTTEILDLDNFM